MWWLTCNRPLGALELPPRCDTGSRKGQKTGGVQVLNDREAWLLMAAEAEKVAALARCPETANRWRAWAA